MLQADTALGAGDSVCTRHGQSGAACLAGRHECETLRHYGISLMFWSVGSSEAHQL